MSIAARLVSQTLKCHTKAKEKTAGRLRHIRYDHGAGLLSRLVRPSAYAQRHAKAEEGRPGGSTHWIWSWFWNHTSSILQNLICPLHTTHHRLCHQHPTPYQTSPFPEKPCQTWRLQYLSGLFRSSFISKESMIHDATTQC